MSTADEAANENRPDPDDKRSADDAGATGSAIAMGAAIAIAASGVLPAFLTGALAVQIKADLAISDTLLGAAVAVLFATATLIAAVAGRIADRLGWQRSVRVVATFAATALGGVAITGRTYVGLLVFLMVGGVAFAMATPTANLLLARSVPTARRGMAFGINQAAIPLSTLLAGLAVPAVALTVGWRWSFAIALVLPLIAISAASIATPRAAEARPARSPSAPFVAPAALRLLAVGGALSALSIGALHGFAVVSAVRSGISEGPAGLLLAVSSLLAISVRVVVGWRIDKVDSDGFTWAVVMMAVGSAGYALLAVQSAALVPVGMFLAYGAGWGWPGLFQYAITQTFHVKPASATGITQTGFASGTALGPIGFGFVADRLGYGWSWSAVVVSSLLAAALTDVAARRLRATLVT